ncbi:type III pantothenate kinase [Marinobacter sp. 71-i]|uniref:Type III pantothenate kinase n=1 Tax=Marinobacter iranensis TaxID=2962607 RepID=A0ABT5YCE2_9GAMM|nr:type III pantothenate kinase [Marinobacter iranensis]MDF0751344.1 type III pantothenate kinase [Marinobacter iranensis]
MKLLVDAGNTRLKWQLCGDRNVVHSGFVGLDADEPFSEITRWSGDIERIAVSTVISEDKRRHLQSRLEALCAAPIVFHWAESRRGGLVNAYTDTEKMGADRWHAMYGAWSAGPGGFAVIDAGSAITVDYVSGSGKHLGGYILPGKQMMLRSLRQDAARIGFDTRDARAGEPGASTTECVQHGLVWLWESMVARIQADCARFGLERTIVTGGDAEALNNAGLSATHEPWLVLVGLAAIDQERELE